MADAYVTQRELKLPTRTSLLNAASHPTGIFAGLLPSIFGVTPARRTGNRSPLSALLLIVPPIVMTLADEGPVPIGKEARPKAMNALPISHAPMALLRRAFERGKLDDGATDRLVFMAATLAGSLAYFEVSPCVRGNSVISNTLNALRGGWFQLRIANGADK